MQILSHCIESSCGEGAGGGTTGSSLGLLSAASVMGSTVRDFVYSCLYD